MLFFFTFLLGLKGNAAEVTQAGGQNYVFNFLLFAKIVSHY